MISYSFYTRLELEINNKLIYSERVLNIEVERKLKDLREVGHNSARPFAIFIKGKKSKANKIILGLLEEFIVDNIFYVK